VDMAVDAERGKMNVGRLTNKRDFFCFPIKHSTHTQHGAERNAI
jgi:hypothetical protein